MDISKILELVKTYDEERLSIDLQIREIRQSREVDTYRKIPVLRNRKANLKRPVSFGQEVAARAWELNHEEPILGKLGITWSDDILKTFSGNGISRFFYVGGGEKEFEKMIQFIERGWELVEFGEVEYMGEKAKGFRFIRKEQ